MASARETLSTFGTRVRNAAARTPRWVVWTVGGVIGGVVLLWVVLNLLLADPRFGTPTTNWALKTFGDKSASVQSGKLRHPFSSTIDIAGLDWPERARAQSMSLSYNLLGFLPAVPWASEVRIDDGAITLKAQSDGKSTFQPQKLVDRINARNVDLTFTRQGKPRTIRIVSASGSLAKGTARAEATAADSHLTFEGLASVAGGSGIEGRITAKGQNLRDLADAVGLAAPNTPPYNVKGKLSSAMRTWTVDSITGRLGDSDIAGKIAVRLGGAKPHLDVQLTSAALDFDDIGIIFGIPTGVGRGETSNDEQKAAKAASDRSARLIPDARIDFARLRAVNADFSLKSPKVTDAPFGVRALHLEGTLKDQILNFTTTHFDMPGGVFDAVIRVDANKDPAATTAKGTLKGVNIGQTLKLTNYIRGTANGVFNIRMTGSGFRDAFGSTTGEVGVWSSNSALSKFATEAAGLDLGELLLNLDGRTKENAEFLPSRCLAAAATFRNGLGQISPAVIDNRDTLIHGKGTINLKNEAIAIEIEASPKDISIGTLKGDVQVNGTFKNPSLKVLDEDTVGQAILAAIAGPLALLPFVETGGSDDAPCRELLADARAAGDGKLARAASAKKPEKKGDRG